MKKLLLSASLTLLSLHVAEAQCVYTCSNYAVSAITKTVFPSGSTNITPTFTNPYLGTFADDGATGAIPIGFNFDFYCNTYTDVYICSNGFFQFDPIIWPNQYVHPTQNIPNSQVPNNMVTFNMTDLDPGVGGTVTYTTVGSSPYRMFVVTFSNVPCFGQSILNTGQMVLFETTNIIEIHTTEANPCNNQSLGGTQGIESVNGSAGISPTVTTSPLLTRNANSSWHGSAANTAYRFSPYSAAPLGPVSGNTILCQGTSGSYQVGSGTGALSYNWTAPQGWTGTSTTTSSSFTANVTGIVGVSANYTCGASAASTIHVKVIPSPIVSISQLTPAIICSGKTISITPTGAVFYSLEPGGMTGPGPFTDMPMVSTQYTLMGTDSSGCNSNNNSNASVLVLETPTVIVNSGAMCQGQSFTMSPSGAPPESFVFSSIFSVVTPTAGVYSYSVTGTATNGCKSEPAVSTVTVHPLPSTTLSAQRLIMCNKETNTLTASGAATYTWAGSTATGNTLQIAPIFSGQYVVTGTSSLGCVQNASINITVNACTGIGEMAPDPAFTIYPNPSSGAFHVQASQAEQVVIFDVLGKAVHRQQVNEGTNQLRLTHLAPGKYILKGMSTGSQRSFVIVND